MADSVPLPRRQIICVCLILLGESFALTVLFPFVGFMVADFGVAPPAEVGFYAGYLASAFSFGQLFSSFFLGWLRCARSCDHCACTRSVKLRRSNHQTSFRFAGALLFATTNSRNHMSAASSRSIGLLALTHTTAILIISCAR